MSDASSADRQSSSSDVDVAIDGCSHHLQSIRKELEDATGKDVDVIDLEAHPDSDQLKGKGKKVY